MKTTDNYCQCETPQIITDFSYEYSCATCGKEPKVESPEDADAYFDSKKEEAKKDFNAACDLYRGYLRGAETTEERLRRINNFRRG